MKQVAHKHTHTHTDTRTHKTQCIDATEQNSVIRCIFRQELVHSWFKYYLEFELRTCAKHGEQHSFSFVSHYTRNSSIALTQFKSYAQYLDIKSNAQR